MAKAEGRVEVFFKAVGLRGLHLQSDKVFKEMSGRQSYYVGMMQSRMGYAMLGMSAAIVGFGVVAVKAFAEFDQAMKNTASVTNATAEQMKLLTEVAKELGTKGTASAKNVADGMYYLGSAGYNVKEIFEAIEPVMLLAVATQSNMADTARILMQTLKAFGKEAKDATRFAEVFAAGISSSQLRMEWLGASMKHLGPVAHEVGMSIQETVAALAMLHDVGIQAGMSGRHLRRMIQGTIKDTKKATDTLSEYGLTLKDISIKQHGFANVMKLLHEKQVDLADVFALFGLRASASAAALVRNAKSFEEYLKNVEDAEALTRMFNVQMQGLQAQFIKLKNVFVVFMIEVIEPFIPAIRVIVKGMTDFIDKLRQLPGWAHKLMGVTAIVTALGLAFLGLNFILAGMLTQGMMTFGLLIAAIKATFLMTVRLAQALSVTLYRALTGYTIVQMKTLAQVMRNIKALGFVGLLQRMSQNFITVATSAKTLLLKLGGFTLLLTIVYGWIVLSVAIWKKWKDKIKEYIDKIKDALGVLKDVVKDSVDWWKEQFDKIKLPKFLRIAIDYWTEKFKKGATIVKTKIEEIIDKHEDLIEGIKGAAKETIEDLKDASVEVNNFIIKIFEKLKGLFPIDLLEDFKDKLEDVLPEWEETVEEETKVIKNFVDNIKGNLSVLEKEFNAFQSTLVDNWTNSIMSLIDGSKAWLEIWKDICNNALRTFIHGFVNQMTEEWGRALARMAWDVRNMQTRFGGGFWSRLLSIFGLGGSGEMRGGVGGQIIRGANIPGGSAWSPHSFETGTDYVPKNMLAYLHRGEKVVTASENKQEQEITIINVVDPSFVNASIAREPNTIINIINNDVLMAGSTRKTMKRYLR